MAGGRRRSTSTAVRPGRLGVAETDQVAQTLVILADVDIDPGSAVSTSDDQGIRSAIDAWLQQL